jgi:hypothetical protein
MFAFNCISLEPLFLLLCLRFLFFASINVPNSHVGMNLAVTEELAHLHEEDLVFVIGPLEDGLPKEEGVA